MSQTIGSVRVKTSSLPIANVTTGAVRIATNQNNPQRVQSINYLPASAQNFKVIDAGDVVFENSENNSSVLTYDNTTDKFVVQNMPRLNGGTF
jgi:hypothetical protein